MWQSFNEVWYDIKGLNDTSGCLMSLWSFKVKKKKKIIWFRITYREWCWLDVGLKWQAIAVFVMLGTSSYSPMTGDNISPWTFLEPLLENRLMYPRFLCALSQNLLSTSLRFDFPCCGLTLCHGWKSVSLLLYPLCTQVVKGPPFKQGNHLAWHIWHSSPSQNRFHALKSWYNLIWPI